MLVTTSRPLALCVWWLFLRRPCPACLPGVALFPVVLRIVFAIVHVFVVRSGSAFVYGGGDTCNPRCVAPVATGFKAKMCAVSRVVLLIRVARPVHSAATAAIIASFCVFQCRVALEIVSMVSDECPHCHFIVCVTAVLAATAQTVVTLGLTSKFVNPVAAVGLRRPIPTPIPSPGVFSSLPLALPAAPRLSARVMGHAPTVLANARGDTPPVAGRL
jgi:hypothetical protein